MEKSPFSVPVMVTAFDFQTHGNMEIVLAGTKGEAGFEALAKAVRTKFLPHAVLLHADGGVGQSFLADKNEAIAGMKPLGDKAAAYLCRNQACQAPVTSVEALEKLLA